MNSVNIIINKATRKLKHFLEDTARTTIFNDPSEDIINQNEIRIFGLRRSGNHAVTNWLIKQMQGELFYINDVGANENPYREKYEALLRSGCLKGRHKLKREARGAFTKKEYLIYSYEDYALKKVTNAAFERKHDLYFGKSVRKYDLLIFRDPFNMIASRLKGSEFQNGYFLSTRSKRIQPEELWLTYAREWLGETNYLKNHKILVSYNQWVTDVNYRKELSASLGLEFSDAGFHEVQGFGGGSSFDGQSRHGEASQMNVLGRWRNFADNEVYINTLNNNNQLWSYSEKIFGHIPGTEQLKR
ncbi:MAG: hypothetical protein AAGA83_12420 [Cyanobacteria bacterium P01_F01_bin.116]